MGIGKIDSIRIDLLDTINDLAEQIDVLARQDPLFGFISEKFIRCGKTNCKCHQSSKSHHGPYFYLRLEPQYKFTKYLGKQIPGTIQEKLDLGEAIKELEKKKKKISETLTKIESV